MAQSGLVVVQVLPSSVVTLVTRVDGALMMLGSTLRTNEGARGRAGSWARMEKPFAGEPRDSCPLVASTRAVVAGPTWTSWNTSMLGAYLLLNLTYISHTDTPTD